MIIFANLIQPQSNFNYFMIIQILQYHFTNIQQLTLQMHNQKQSKIEQLRQWMTQKGCLIHPDIQIPSFINGYQGVATTAIIPPKTLVIAVPSSLILTVTKCYKDPQLKTIFIKNDDLFDYQASDDCEFNVLCVFLMYHKMNIDTSQWKIYLETIGEPQTAVDWPDKMLKGLNKSAIQQILHIRIQCDKLRDQLSAYLATTKQFSRFPLQQIKQCFNYCYRAVMTRCFGYYFGQASLIPIADLINHGCQVVDHQLINVKFQKNLEFNEDYKEKSDKIDCEILGIKRGKNVLPPFRERYLISNGLVECDFEVLAGLDRKKMDAIIAQHNQRLLKQGQADITGLEFCYEDDSQDNDTDVDEQNQRELQLERMHLEELQQIENFKKYYQSVKVETYKEVQDRFQNYQKQLEKSGDKEESQKDTMQESQVIGKSRNDMLIGEVKAKVGVIEQSNYKDKPDEKIVSLKGEQKQQQVQVDNEADWEDEQEGQATTIKSTHKTADKSFIQTTTGKPSIQSQPQNLPNHTNPQNINSLFFDQTPKPATKATVPIQMLQSSSSQSQDDQQWGLLPESYFTLSTSSAVAANKQLFNSYGSRTNKFLLIWYGFCYRDNLYDSVSLRLHVQFCKHLPEAKDIVLDTYVGGQGLTFRKNESELVKGNEVSREFRLKLNKVCVKLLTFLRLYLLDYYKGKDLYKICVTLPSSIQFQVYVLEYYKQIIEALYDRYPLRIINQLKEELWSEQTPQQDKHCIRFKIIYLQEQRKIIDQNMDSAVCMLKVWGRIKERKQSKQAQTKTATERNQLKEDEFDKTYYEDFSIYQLRKLQHYLTTLKKNYSYVIYDHTEQQQKSATTTETSTQ